MTFNIEGFKAQGLRLGGARPTLFEVQCTFPAGVPTIGILQGGRFLISASQLPASLIDEIRVPYFGRSIKVAGDRTFENWPVTVLNDEDFALRNAFETWHNLMNTMVSNRLSPEVAGPIGGQQSYKTDLVVRQFMKEGPPSESGMARQYRIIGAFPNAISPIPVDWADTNRIEQFEVSFSYDYWVVDGGVSTGFAPVIPPDSTFSVSS